jgi:hypothetical protein
MNDRIRRYTPLLTIVAAVVIAAFGLPSVLNLPQSNPTTVAEYAPVPPDQDSDSPPGGNFGGLGLGETGTVEDGSLPGLPPPSGRSSERSKFRCVIVNGVPRQTEDPLSPPCVAGFEGDNGGSTYKGVTKDEISVVFYIHCSETNNTYSPTSRGQEGATCGDFVDLDDPPSDADFIFTRALKRYAAYFNTRFQTYNRHVHMYAFYGHTVTAVVGPGGCREDCRRQDAAETIEEANPFAVIIDGGIADYMDSYIEYMTGKGVLNFGGSDSRRSDYYRQHPGLLWSYGPSIDQDAEAYANYLCRQVVPHPVSFSDAGDNGKKRKFGIIYLNREGDPFYPVLKNLVVQKIKACGANAQIPEAGYTDQGSVDGDPGTAATKAAALTQMRDQGVTTVLWMGPPNGTWGKQARAIGWQPEWVVFGDGGMEDFVTGRYVDQQIWDDAWVLSRVTLVQRQDDQPCALALREVDPTFPTADLAYSCGFYSHLRQLFTGIQVAGPKLTPKTIDQGFHTIPAVASTSPQVPACFYLPGDYTCVKDAIPMYWDADGQIRGWSGSGCYKVVEGGKRYLIDDFPKRNTTAAMRRSSDVCNAYTSNSSFNPHQNTG